MMHILAKRCWSTPPLLLLFFLIFPRSLTLAALHDSQRLKQASKPVLPAWYFNLLRSVPLQVGVQISVSDIAL